MTIHPLKTVVLHFGYGNPRYQYTMNGCTISDASSVRDLGVIVDESCSPSSHVQTITKKANGVLSQLDRTLISRNQKVITGLFKTFVRPVLESAVSAWSPWQKQDINAIERIQRRATRMIPGIGTLEYEDRLKVCNMTTLEQRRRRGDMIEVYKLINEFTSGVNKDFLCFTSQHHNFRSVENKFLVSEKCRLDVRKNFFSNLVVNCWNSLPLDVREADSVNNFF